MFIKKGRIGPLISNLNRNITENKGESSKRFRSIPQRNQN